MKNIVIIANTEYHLLVTASLICEGPWAGEAVKFRVIEAGPTDGARLKAVKNRAALGVEYEQWDIDLSDSAASPAIGSRLKDLLTQDIDTLVVFLEHLPINVYLIKKLKKKGVKIILAPDGMKPYYDLDFGTWRSFAATTRGTLEFYRYVLKSRLMPDFLYKQGLRYGMMAEIDQLLVSYPDRIRNTSNKEVGEISICTSDATKQMLGEVFEFQQYAGLPIFDGIVFYVNNIQFSEAAYKKEREVLQYLVGLDSNGVFVKLHPQTPEGHIDGMKRLGVTVINGSIPAELYISKLSGSAIVSGWSTSLMQRNDSCHHYWLTRYFSGQGCMYDAIDLTNPSLHIQEPAILEEIALPASA